MLVAAFVGWTAGVYLAPVARLRPGPVLRRVAGPHRRRSLCALLAAVLVSLLHAWLSITVRADQIISGTIINIAAFGITGYLNTLLTKSLADRRRASSRRSRRRPS